MKNQSLKRMAYVAALLVLTLATSVTARADGIPSATGDTFIYDGLKYTVTDIDNKTVSCTGYDGTCPESVTIPAEAEGFTVTGIGDQAFKDCSGLTSISLPETVETLGKYCFACSGLTDVTIPAKVTVIPGSAFSTSSLKSVVLPEGLLRIDDFAFNCCHSLTTADLPETLEAIGSNAFAYTRIGQLEITPSLKSIGSEAFGSTYITTLTIPATLEKFYSAFKYCSKLQSVTIEEGIKEIPDYAFQYCSELKEVSLPSTLTAICYDAFAGCRKLDNVVIPPSVKTIKSSAFKGFCGSMTVMATTPPSLYSEGIGVDEMATVYVPAASLGRYQKSIKWAMSLKSLCPLEGWVVEDGAVVHAPWYDNLVYARIPSVQRDGSVINAIGDSAFKGCASMTAFNLDNRISSIGAEAFMDCTALTELSLPSYLRRMGDSAFKNCAALTAISMLTDKPVTIGAGAFDNTGDCPITVQPSMVDGYQAAYPGYASRFGASDKDFLVFEYCVDPNRGHYAILQPAESYKSLTVLRLPSEIKKDNLSYRVRVIGDDAFNGCTNLTGVVSAEYVEDQPWTQRMDVEEIGARAFKGCTSLTNVNTLLGIDEDMYGMLSEIGEEAFSGCTAITSLPTAGSIRVGTRAFAGCTGVGPVSFGNYCYFTLGDNVFDGCTGITQFVFSRTEPIEITEHSFDGTDCPIYVPDAAVEVYKEAWPQYADRISGMGKTEGDTFIYEYNADGTASIVDFADGVVTYSLTSLTIPATTTFAGKDYSITRFAIKGDKMMPGGLFLPELKELIVNAPLKEFSEINLELGPLETIVLPQTLEVWKNMYVGSENLTSIDLPGSLRRLEIHIGCRNLKEITIPANVEYLNGWCLEGSNGLEKITVRAQTPPAIGGDRAFDDTNDCPIIVPANVVDDYKSADGWSAYADRIVGGKEVQPGDFQLSDQARTLFVGGTHKLRALEWESSDPDVVTVDEDGNLRAISEGDALITARTLDGKLQSSCMVSVENPSSTSEVRMGVDRDATIIDVHDLSGVKLLGEGATADDLRALSHGVYIVRTTAGTYKLRL